MPAGTWTETAGDTALSAITVCVSVSRHSLRFSPVISRLLFTCYPLVSLFIVDKIPA